jgi:hypothetical protein
MFDQELPKIITKEIKDKVQKEKRNLKIQTLGRNTVVSDGVSPVIGLVLEGVQEFVGGKVIGSVVNIILSPLSKKTEREIKKLDFKGQKIVKELTNENNIFETIKSFSINSLKL